MLSIRKSPAFVLSRSRELSGGPLVNKATLSFAEWLRFSALQAHGVATVPQRQELRIEMGAEDRVPGVRTRATGGVDALIGRASGIHVMGDQILHFDP